MKKWGAVAALCLVLLQPLVLLVPAGVAYAQGTGPAASTTAQLPKQVDGCATSWAVFLSSPGTCLVNNFTGLLFTAPVTLASWFLTATGTLFNYLLEKVIIGFGPNIYESIRVPLQTAWSTFRDLANILIVGMFVFIAISIILEIEEFGRKRLVVDVIIIAVLINFSLLFTKLAIDSSNFVAYQFYNATLVQQNGSGGTTQTESKGIAEAFLESMGVTGIFDTASALSNSAQGSLFGGTVTIILHSIALTVLLLGAAAILLYGVFLLSIRVVIIILLLLFSSLAFATYLIPGKSRNLFWSWISELIGVVVFAPILMLMLWVTLQMAKALKTAPGSGTLGSFVANPTATQGGAVGALFSYIIIGGLLYATFYIANSLSNKAKGTALLTGKLRAGGIIGGAFALRNTLGRFAFGRSNAYKTAGETQGSRAGRAQARADRLSAAGDTERAKKWADLAIARQKQGAKDAKTSARWGSVAGLKFGGSKSYSGIMADRTKEGEAATKKLQPDEEARKAIREESVKAAQAQHEQQLKTLETTKKMAEDTMKAAQENAKTVTEHNKAESELHTAKQEQAQHEQAEQQKESQHQATLKQLREEAVQQQRDNNAAGAEAAQQKEREEVARRETERKAQNEKIQKARAEVTRLQKTVDTHQQTITQAGGEARINTALADATKAFKQAADDLNKHKEVGKSVVKEADKLADQAIAKTMQGIGEELGKRSGTIAERFWGGLTGDNAKVGKAVAKKFKYREKSDKDKMWDAIKNVQNDDADDGKTDDKKEPKK